MSIILTETKDFITYITLNNPSKMNALSDELWEEFGNVMDRVTADDMTKVIVIRGTEKAFSAGWDLTPKKPPKKPPANVIEWKATTEFMNGSMWKVWNCPKPVIAQVRGYCLGGGCDLSMVCDLTFASEGAVFGEPEIMFNSHPPFEIVAWVLGLKKAKQFILTGEYIDAKEAERVGLITKCLPDDELDAEVKRVATRMSRMPVVAMMMNKRSLNRCFEYAGLRDGIEAGADGFAMTLSYISPEKRKFNYLTAHEGTRAAIKWRDAYFAGDPNAILEDEFQNP
jgi:enoyl-CoA hydratase